MAHFTTGAWAVGEGLSAIESGPSSAQRAPKSRGPGCAALCQPPPIAVGHRTVSAEGPSPWPLIASPQTHTTPITTAPGPQGQPPSFHMQCPRGREGAGTPQPRLFRPKGPMEQDYGGGQAAAATATHPPPPSAPLPPPPQPHDPLLAFWGGPSVSKTEPLVPDLPPPLSHVSPRSAEARGIGGPRGRRTRLASVLQVLSGPITAQPCGLSEFFVPGDLQCRPCVGGAVCNGTAHVVTRPNWWRLHNASSAFFECGPARPCRGGTPTGTCRPTFRGPLCGLCVADHAGRACEACGPWGWGLMALALLCVAYLSVLYLIIVLALRKGHGHKNSTFLIAGKVATTHLQVRVRVRSGRRWVPRNTPSPQHHRAFRAACICGLQSRCHGSELHGGLEFRAH